MHQDTPAPEEVYTWATASCASATATRTPATLKLASARYQTHQSAPRTGLLTDGNVSKHTFVSHAELPAQHPGGAVRAVRPGLLWRPHCWHSRGLSALRLPPYRPRQPVSPGTASTAAFGPRHAAARLAHFLFADGFPTTRPTSTSSQNSLTMKNLECFSSFQFLSFFRQTFLL